ncbi:thyrotropin-releasing hormone receptor-like [Anneissia japonica]|uniref:thyrotropin-releasing hormone receptor-like n=1 Tax=Anneissia japonica TaxID=1529436 RepID=UPI00142566EF|nr:thyrotropin-releasing hormone receptor-like [Anneissia japonica]
MDSIMHSANTLEYCQINSSETIICNEQCFKFTNLTEDHRYSDWDKTCVCYIFPAILLLGIVTNVSFIFVSFRISYLHTAINNFLINLSIADMLFLSVAVGEKLYNYLDLDVYSHTVYKTNAGCIIISILKNSTSFTAQIIVTLIALERYRVIRYPLQAYTVNSRVRVRRHNVCSWFVAVILSATMSPAVGKHQSYCGLWIVDLKLNDTEFVIINNCDDVNHAFVIYYEFIQTVPFFFAWTISSIIHGLTIQGLKQSISDSTLHPKGSDTLTKAGNQVTSMLLINGITFFLLLAPFQIRSLMAMIRHLNDHNYNDRFLNIGRLLLYTNAAINPIIYVIINRRYRNAYILAFWRCRSNDIDDNITGRSCTGLRNREALSSITLTRIEGINNYHFDTHL